MSRKDIIKKSLGITEYPWSSDDGLEEVSPIVNESITRRPPTEPRPSVADMPGTSGSQSSGPLLVGQQQASTSRKRQDRADRELYWSLINGSHILGATPHSSSRHRSSEPPVLSRVTHTPAEELRERPPDSAAADIRRIIAFNRITRNLGSMRRTIAGIIPVTRVNPGTVLPSEANSAIRIDSTLSRLVRPHSGRIRSNRIGSRSLSSYPRIHIRPRERAEPGQPADLDVTIDVDSPHQTAPVQDISIQGNPVQEESFEAEGTSNHISAAHDTAAPEPTAESQLTAPEPSARLGDYPDTNQDGLVTIDVDMPDIPERSADPANPSVDVDELVRQTMTAVTQIAVSETLPQPTMPTSHGVKRKRRDSNESVSESFTVKEFNKKLLRLLECPVCLEWMEPPIAQCRRGHLVCGGCREQLSSCPICRVAFSSVRNRAMEGVAELLLYPCRHACGRHAGLRARAAHEASCAARRYRCPAPACAGAQPLPHAALAHHFQSKHLPLIKFGCRHKFSMKVNVEQHDNWLILAMEQYFHLKIDVDIRTWGVVVYVSFIGPKCDANNYTYEVTVDGQHNNRKITYSRSTHSDLESSSLNVSRQDCFHLTLDQALNFIRLKNRHCDSNKFLDFNVQITKTENSSQQDTD